MAYLTARLPVAELSFSLIATFCIVVGYANRHPEPTDFAAWAPLCCYCRSHFAQTLCQKNIILPIYQHFEMVLLVSIKCYYTIMLSFNTCYGISFNFSFMANQVSISLLTLRNWILKVLAPFLSPITNLIVGLKGPEVSTDENSIITKTLRVAVWLSNLSMLQNGICHPALPPTSFWDLFELMITNTKSMDCFSRSGPNFENLNTPVVIKFHY